MGRASRARRDAVSPGSSVLDLGCGEGLLRQFLPIGCTWKGYDLRPLGRDIEQIDLDAGEFPVGRYDCIVLLGVLAWLKEPAAALVRARGATNCVIISDNARIWSIRRPLQLKTGSRLDHLLTRTGWACEAKLLWKKAPKREYYVCRLVSDRFGS
jgi:hypothetical protein